MSRRAALEKAKEVEKVERLINQHKVIGVANLKKMRAAQLQELKRKLEHRAYLLVVKNTLVKRAIDKCKNKPRLQDLGKIISGSNIYLFTNINPFKLVMLLERGKVKTTAKAGDLASQDVIIPAGNTGIPPGPIISQFSAIGLPTRIEAGSVWVNRDTRVAKKGDVIEARLAGVLSKLGLKPVEVGLMLKACYDEGLIITEEQLRLDLEEVRRDIKEAHTIALNLSLNVVYPTPENITILIRTAQKWAYQLTLSAVIFTPDTVINFIRKAYVEMLSLSRRMDLINKRTTNLVQKS